MREAKPEVYEWYVKCPHCDDSNYMDKLEDEYKCIHCGKVFKLLGLITVPISEVKVRNKNENKRKVEVDSRISEDDQVTHS